VELGTDAKIPREWPTLKFFDTFRLEKDGGDGRRGSKIGRLERISDFGIVGGG